ncbi:C39 family peptidase [Aquibacillus rhizosphaerae]|uniref:C39 family peptidase n=1 Tax=Aquibacillus rhizosphaerae TaxID=3051431 RepID=A0ABT7LDA5_9BACI|nr:C39 family peptidase [Aquibacillus sp. LR5S19]MDL4842575.1 C39 family peptidase [Aquibacillus sp. LR5S19]
MFQFLLFFSLMMTLLLSYLAKRPTKYIVKQAIKTYAILFGVCTMIVSGILLNTFKTEIYEWFLINSRESQVIATTLPAPELEPVFPLIEQIQLRDQVQIDAPIIGQHPELPRGCEVTSLAMLLQFYDIDVSKMELAEQVKKDTTPYKKTESGIYFGNPSKGFVGDMYSFSKPGLGVYHEPIADLAKKYLGERVVDFSGGSFYEILNHINQDRPVWVITNSTYKKLEDKFFETWQTDDGPIRITMKEHSVLVTGYDDEFIYFNDPIKAETRKAPIENFKEAWVQMGKQAITVVTP